MENENYQEGISLDGKRIKTGIVWDGGLDDYSLETGHIDISIKIEKYKHVPTGFIGTYVEKKNGYYGEVTIIKLIDSGKEYFAPSHEFVKLL